MTELTFDIYRHAESPDDPAPRRTGRAKRSAKAEEQAAPDPSSGRVLGPEDVDPRLARVERDGNPVLPQEVYDVLVGVCDRWAGRPVERDEDFGAILCEVASRTAHLGFGVSRKAGGRHVESPVGPIAEDVLQHCPTGHHWDVLGSAARGNPLRPGRGPSIGIMRDQSRPCVSVPAGSVQPAWPAGAGPGPGPDPDPGNGGGHTPPPPPPPPSGGSNAEVLAAIGRLEARQERIEARLGELMSSADIHALIGTELIANHLQDIKVRVDGVRGAAEAAQHAAQGARCRLRFGAGAPEGEGDPERPAEEGGVQPPPDRG